jgi:hypothetical protein
MLRSVGTSNRIIDLLTPERRIHHDWLIVKFVFYLLQQLRQPLQVADFFLCRRVVKLTVVCDGQFRKGEVFT